MRRTIPGLLESSFMSTTFFRRPRQQRPLIRSGTPAKQKQVHTRFSARGTIRRVTLVVRRSTRCIDNPKIVRNEKRGPHDGPRFFFRSFPNYSGKLKVQAAAR